MSFRREKFYPRGGPDGGDGGRGGDVIFVVNPQLGSLLDFRYKRRFNAEDGEAGGGSLCSGKAGQDCRIEVPPGTLLKRFDDGSLIAELLEPGQELVLLKGGRGGKGNAFFKTSVNQAPMYAQPGETGEELQIKMELKLLADVGIIGYPNAGKSTLISRISAAHPKVADYPFTTLVPNLGVVDLGEGRSCVVADIPGLIPGAHTGAGLGIKFLKHVERTKGFVHLVDASQFSGRDPLQDYEDILAELRQYDVDLSQRPQLVVLNKLDVCSDEELKKVRSQFQGRGIKTMEISAVMGRGIKELVHEIGRLSQKAAHDA